MGKLNIVMAAFNKSDLTKKTIESVLSSTTGDYKYIIVNNGSTDDTDEIISGYAVNKKVQYIKEDKNLGCGIGRNCGLRKIDNDCEHVILIDNDIEVSFGWNDKLISFLERHPEIGLCGPCTNFAGSPQLIENVPPLETPLDKEVFAKNFNHSQEFTYVPDGWPVIGFCMAIRKSVIDKVGLFDEKFKLYGCEDNDYCIRVQNAGWKLAYYYGLFVYHIGHGSIDELGKIKLDGKDWVHHFESNQEYFKKKHGSI